MPRYCWNLLFVLMLCLGCKSSKVDYYELFKEACLSDSPAVTADGGEEIPPACQSILEQTLPFDASFDAASKDKKQAILYAFFKMMNAPLAYPKNNKMLGQGAHTVPLQGFCLLTPELHPSGCEQVEGTKKMPNPNRALINYVLDKITKFSYEPGTRTDYRLASFENLAEGTMVFYDNFWSKFSTNAWYAQMAVLVHESKHAHATWHIYCGDDRGFSCDSDFSGAYGLEATVLEMLLHGEDQNKTRQLNDQKVLELARFLCSRIARILASAKPWAGKGETGCAQLPLSFFVQMEDLTLDPAPHPVEPDPKPPVDPTQTLGVE